MPTEMNPVSSAHTVASPTGIGENTSLWAERVDRRSYIAHNARGAEVRIGQGENEFSPGELLKLALGGCNAMSADASLVHYFGRNFVARFGVSADYDEETDRYTRAQVEIIITPDENAPQATQELIAGDALAQLVRDVTASASTEIARRCTIEHTLTQTTPSSVTLTIETPQATLSASTDQ